MEKRSRKESYGFILVTAGLGFFVIGFIFQMLGPIIFLRDIPMETIEEIAAKPSWEFRQLAEEYPEEFKAAFGEVTPASYAEALRHGRDTYIAEACWHCHSQYVRPIAKEPVRYGKVSVASEYQNELQLPQLFGTRRVGPDLIRQSGVHSNDWHVAHLYDPPSVQPGSIMPGYTWFFDEDGRPAKRALSVVTYLQWLGSWQEGGDL
ncbi:MAG: cbb3-type cytochrome c oxidase subunit II [Thermodesulfobacteriota bacterium]